MASKQVQISISPEGKVKFETVGYSGTECREVDLAMVRVGTIHNDQVTSEGCQPSVMPAYNELHINQQQ